ncbi:MAG: type 11 methyltransferase [Paenibacillus sp.]|jgi:ubiquinone/menaquinone biosynthesis C-methylase UbiE|nr:type 11 methyltransferase [Paenibacillus sp.]
MMQTNKNNLKQNQYGNEEKFKHRIQLHKQFSTNKYPWPFWVFDYLPKRDHAKVLELGGGNGLLWMVNVNRVPENWDITITDLSAGMLENAQKNLPAYSNLHFKVVDAEQIDYPDSTFDIVIANHMLYHVENREKALLEIRRVLKPDGMLYASTVGNGNMLELKELIQEYDRDSNYDTVLRTIETRFSLENGEEQLKAFFSDVQLHLYEDSLLVTDADVIVRYVLSLNDLETGATVLDPNKAEHFKTFLDEKMKQSGGKLHIHKASGMFICKQHGSIPDKS